MELNRITQKVQDARITEKQYRSLKDRLSYSSLKLYDNDRASFFKQLILGETPKEKTSFALVLGSLIHCLLSGEDCFDSKFHLLSAIEPVGQMKLLCDNLVERTFKTLDDEGRQMDSFETLFGDAFLATKFDAAGKEVNFKGKTVEKALELFSNKDPELYYRECIDARGKMTITASALDFAENTIIKKLREHPFSADIVNAQTSGEVEVFNELPILFDIEEVPFKSMIDKLIVNHGTKTIQPYDYKTSWDSESPENSYIKHSYYLQSGLYNVAIGEWAKEHKLENYLISPMSFVFIDTNGFNAPIVLTLTQNDLDRAMRGFVYRTYKYAGVNEIINSIAWNLETGNWTTTKTIYENNGIVPLRIAYGSRN